MSRVLLPGLVLMLLVPAAAGADPVADFWSWFEADAARIQAAPDDARIRASMSYWLGRIGPGLSYDLRSAGRKQELVISADGDIARFVTVQRIIRDLLDFSRRGADDDKKRQ